MSAGPARSVPGPPRLVPGPPRLVTVWFPNWPVIAAGVPPDRSAAVLHANRVVAVSSAAEADGVRPGLRRREAQARSPQLQIIAHDPERDARRFEPVARSIGELVPVLELTEPGWLTFATRGPSRYVGGDEPLARRIVELAVQGVTAEAAGDPNGPAPVVGVGIADGRFASGVAARCAVARGGPVVVAPGPEATAGFLAPFPLRALHEVGAVPLELIDLLGRLGARRLAQVAELPATDVLARFGPDGAHAHLLARGADPRPADAVPPPPELTVTRAFDDPVVQVEPLVFLAKQAVAELHDGLGVRGMVATRLVVEAETEHGERTERAWYRPVGLNAAAMVERIRWQLDGWVRQPGGLSGGVISLRLTPAEVRADAGRQLGFWGGHTQADDWALRATTRLAGLLGPEAVTVPEWRGGRDPAAAFALVPAGTSDLAEPADRRAGTRPAARGAPPWPGGLPAPSPACVLSEPLPCTVLDAAGDPVRVSGRGTVSGEPAVIVIDRHPSAVVAWAGPWPVEERWWDPDHANRRARFQLVTAAGEALLTAVVAGQWQIDARYE